MAKSKKAKYPKTNIGIRDIRAKATINLDLMPCGASDKVLKNRIILFSLLFRYIFHRFNNSVFQFFFGAQAAAINA